MKYRLVIADVDGTLLPPSEVPSPRPPDNLIQIVKQVMEKGVHFSLATGRSLSWVEELIKGFTLVDPIILDNGARVYNPAENKYIWESLLPKEISRQVLDVFVRFKDLHIIVTDDGVRLEDISKIKDWRISKILALGVTPVKAEELVSELRSIQNIHVTRSISGTGEKSQSVHVTNFDATKQVAVGKLLEFMDIKKEEVIGIGDSYNDFPLLMASGLKVAMGNAVEDLQSIADYIAPSYDKGGVIEVLKKYILNDS